MSALLNCWKLHTIQSVLFSQFYFISKIFNYNLCEVFKSSLFKNIFFALFMLGEGGGQVKNECPLVFSSGVCGVNIGFLIR